MDDSRTEYTVWVRRRSGCSVFRYQVMALFPLIISLLKRLLSRGETGILLAFPRRQFNLVF